MLTKRLLTRLIYSILTLHTLLYIFDSLPLLPTLLSLVSHAIYALNLRRFPLVQLSDPVFLLSCVLVGLNHWLWFRFWSDPVALQARVSPKASSGSDYYYASGAGEYPSFVEIASFFGLCVWLVPFALFVSLSAGENVLPYTSATTSTTSASVGVGGGGDEDGDGGKTKRVGMAKAVVDGVREWMGETGQGFGWWRGGKARRF